MGDRIEEFQFFGIGKDLLRKLLPIDRAAADAIGKGKPHLFEDVFLFIDVPRDLIRRKDGIALLFYHLHDSAFPASDPARDGDIQFISLHTSFSRNALPP